MVNEMKRAADFRQTARLALAGKWGIALAVTLVAALLGGAGNTGFNVDFTVDAGDLSNIYGRDGFNLAAVLAWLGLPSVWLTSAVASISGIAFIYAIAVLVVGGAVELGHNLYYIRLIRGESAGFDTLFSRFEIFLKALGLRLFMLLFILLWALLLIIPGIIATYRYRMAPYLMAEHPEMGIREAVNESKRMMMGYKGRWFCLDLSFIGWILLCVLTLGIGFLWVNPYRAAASADFYLNILGEQSGRTDPQDGPQFEYGGPERL